MKTCLFGGSFDPVHAGHLAVAAAARRRLALDRVVFLPANRSPFKTAEEDSPLFNGRQRVQLLRAATVDLSWASVSEMDLKLPPPSWSWRIVEQWKQAEPQDELYWLLGTDQWEELHRWARYDYLVRQLTFIVCHRGAAPRPRSGVRAFFLESRHPQSSTAIRAQLAARIPVEQGWLPPTVEEQARRFLSPITR